MATMSDSQSLGVGSIPTCPTRYHMKGEWLQCLVTLTTVDLLRVAS